MSFLQLYIIIKRVLYVFNIMVLVLTVIWYIFYWVICQKWCMILNIMILCYGWLFPQQEGQPWQIELNSSPSTLLNPPYLPNLVGYWRLSHPGKVCLIIGTDIPPVLPLTVEAHNQVFHVTLMPLLHEHLGLKKQHNMYSKLFLTQVPFQVKSEG